MATPNKNREDAMSPILKTQSGPHHLPSATASNRRRAGNENATDFDLRDTLTATVVRELSFAEFRAALAQSGKRLN
jgi:hypothetical protein